VNEKNRNKFQVVVTWGGQRNCKLSVSIERPSSQKKVGCWRGAVRTCTVATGQTTSCEKSLGLESRREWG